MNTDGYVRLSHTGAQLGMLPNGPGPLLFVDLDGAVDVARLRDVPHEYLAVARDVVTRGSAEQAEVVRRIVEDTRCTATCWRVEHRLGESPRLLPAEIGPEGTYARLGRLYAWARGQATPPASVDASRETRVAVELLDRCRAVELRSLLDWGQAIWEAENFHFLLPSGRHSQAFVRLANAFGRVRDVAVIAKWLLAHAPDKCGLVADTHSVVPLVLALDSEMRQLGAALGEVRLLDGYPTTRWSVEDAVRWVTERSAAMVGIVSVNSTGTVRELLGDAASALGPVISRSEIVTLVDLQSGDGRHVRERLKLSTMLSLKDPRNPKKFDTYDADCPHCVKTKRAALVPVDVDTFDVRFPTLLQQETPSVADPRKNRTLWEAAKRTNALEFESAADQHVQVWRATGKMGWKVNWNKLLEASGLHESVRERLVAEIEDANHRLSKRHVLEEDWSKFDTVLVPADDYDRPGFATFWDGIKIAFGPSSNVVAVPLDSDWPAETREAVTRARRILVFTLGTVTGTTLQRMLNRVQAIRKDADYRLFGAVIHARPSRRRTWEVLVNSYAYRLIAAYLNYLPDQESPLRHETRHLESLQSNELSSAEQAFLEGRRSICRGEDHPAHGVLWGSTPADVITPHSIYGDRLDARTTFIAVGSALHARREAERDGPIRIVFEMPAIARSYYDPIIFASMLRWLSPGEIWWGTTLSGAEQVINDVVQRATFDQQRLLLAELLLACVEGKIPRRGREAVETASRTWLARKLPDSAPVEFGLRLLGTRSREEDSAGA